MSSFPYRLTGPIGAKGTLGLLVLQVDETIEQDFRKLFPQPDVALYVSRVPSGNDLTPDTISTMEATLPQATSLLPPAASFDVVGYACTSGTTLIGAETVEALVADHATTRAVTNPLSAAFVALDALGARSVAIVSPYVASVAQPIRAAFEQRGFEVPATVSFGEQVEARVARIDPASIRDAALQVGSAAGVEAVFLSCTNLRTLEIIDDLEAQLGVPVISSNLALAWHMARLAGIGLSHHAPGQLAKR